MGKKLLSQETLKVSKSHEKPMKKQQLNSLIQVLRPKVYITDSSTFKTLVQELTGNGSSSSACPPTHDPETMAVVHGHEVGGDPEMSSSCMEAFSDASLESLEPCSNNYYPVSSSSTEEELFNNQIFLEETTTTNLLMNHHHQQAAELLEYQQDLESWLLDIDPAYSCYNLSAHHHQIQQDVSIYDYELSGWI